MLYKCTAGNELLEGVPGDKVVVFAIDLAGAGKASGVWKRDGQARKRAMERDADGRR